MNIYRYFIFYLVLCVFVVLGIGLSFITWRFIIIPILYAVIIPIVFFLKDNRNNGTKLTNFIIRFTVSLFLSWIIIKLTNTWNLMLSGNTEINGIIPSYSIPNLLPSLFFVSIVYIIFLVVFSIKINRK